MQLKPATVFTAIGLIAALLGGQTAPTTTAAAPPAPAFQTGGVALTFGAKKLTDKDIDAAIDALPEDMKKQALSGMGKRAFIEQYAEYLFLLDEANERKLADRPEVKKQLEFQRDNTLVGLFLRDLAKQAEPSDDDVKAYYEGRKADYLKVKASHILIRTADSSVPKRDGAKDMTDAEAMQKAQQLRDRITAGQAKFEDVAKAESDDRGSGESGGSLGEFGKGQMVPQFEEAAFATPQGMISQPLRTPFGYHLIRVEERGFQELAQVQGQLKQRLQGERLNKLRDDLRKQRNYSVSKEYLDSLVPPAPPVPPTGAVPGTAPVAPAPPKQ